MRRLSLRRQNSRGVLNPRVVAVGPAISSPDDPNQPTNVNEALDDASRGRRPSLPLLSSPGGLLRSL